MVKANNVVWDVSTPDNDVAQRYCGELYQPLDSALVDPNAYKKGTVSSPCGAPSYVYANMFSYVAGAYKGKVPTSINDFFDVAKFPGQRVLYDLADTGILEAALVADGVAPDKLYPMDLNRAFAKLDTIKSHLTLAPTLGAVGQALSGGQATMTLLPTARMVTTALAGVDLQPVWDFTTYAAGVLAITKGSPNAAMAEKAIKAILTKESAVKYAQLTGTAPALASVTSADVKYDPVQARFDAFDPKYQRGTVIPKDETYWATHYSEIVDRWNKWKVG
jgi:putative spermidine/putrescine transport system substrate-binding protein